MPSCIFSFSGFDKFLVSEKNTKDLKQSTACGLHGLTSYYQAEILQEIFFFHSNTVIVHGILILFCIFFYLEEFMKLCYLILKLVSHIVTSTNLYSPNWKFPCVFLTYTYWRYFFFLALLMYTHVSSYPVFNRNGSVVRTEAINFYLWLLWKQHLLKCFFSWLLSC